MNSSPSGSWAAHSPWFWQLASLSCQAASALVLQPSLPGAVTRFRLRPLQGMLGDTQGTKSPPCALCPEPTAPVTAASSSLHSKLLPQPSETAGALTACPPACRPFGTA